MLTVKNFNSLYKKPASAVVIEVATGDILALVSRPVFDLNKIRRDYGDILAEKDRPLINTGEF